MVYAKGENRPPAVQTPDLPPQPPETSSLCRSPQVLTGSHLKSLYCLLVQMALDQSIYQYKVGDAFSMATWKCGFEVKIMFKDITNLSDALFKDMHKRFKQLVMDYDLSPFALKQAGQHLDTFHHLEDFPSLLRCCMVILQFLEFDSSLVLEKCKILLSILKWLCSSDLRLHVPYHKMQNGKSKVSFKRQVADEHMYTPDGSVNSTLGELDSSTCFAGQVGSRVSFFCSILEVFADELLVRRQLKDYLLRVERVSSAKEKAFVSHGGGEDVVLEVISAHFLMSVSDERARERFPQTLFWSYGGGLEIPQLSLLAAMTFLGNLVVSTAPQIFQAHLVSLVSSCIGISMEPKYSQVNPVLLSNYLSAFEQSLNLYTRLLQKCDHSIGHRSRSDFWHLESCIPGSGIHSNFESYVRPETYAEINLQIDKLVNTCCPYFRDALSRTKSDLVSASMTYIKENQFVLDEGCRAEACSILSFIIERSLSEEIEVNGLHKSGEISQHEIYLLASVVKLMSCSLLQIIWLMRQSANSKILKKFSLYGEYDFVIGIVRRFEQYGAYKPIQKTLSDVMGSYPAKHRETKFMLMHFAGLLSFCFDKGPEFLWKGCLFMLMTLMNLLISEEGNLDALKPLLGHKEKPSFSSPCSTKIPEGLTYRRSSELVAFHLQKIKMLYVRERDKPLSLACDIRRVDNQVSNVAVTQEGQLETSQSIISEDTEERYLHVEDEDNSCNGEVFLKCMGVSPGYDDDLSDFIVCKPGKDYSSWLKRKERYRRWRHEGRTVALRERNRRSWKDIRTCIDKFGL